MIYLFILFTIIVVSIFLIDVVPELYVWQSRIKIGRFASAEIWKNKVVTRSKKWLQNVPTIPISDNKRLIVIDILRNNYKRTAVQSWQEAALILGLNEYIKRTSHSQTQREVDSFFATKITSSGSWKVKPTEIDHAMIAYAFLNIESINHQKYKSAFDETYQMILSLKGEDGTIAYKNHVREFRFVDTVGFVSPFLVLYGIKFNVTEAIDLAVKQITEYQKYGMMPTENIPCHTYNVHTKIPTGLFGWGRGLGWFVIGLIDTWKLLPSEHPDKKILQTIIVETAKSATKYQNENGSFPWLLFDHGSRSDSSVTATLSWFYNLASEIPEITNLCTTAKHKCNSYLQSATRRNGAVDFSQGDTKGIGVYSHNFDILPFTQGFVLRNLFYNSGN